MRNFKTTFGILAICLINTQTFCQENFLGNWKGELTQKPDSKYYFEINIDEIDLEGKF